MCYCHLTQATTCTDQFSTRHVGRMNDLVNVFHRTAVLFPLSVKNPDLQSWPCFSNVPICTLFPDVPQGGGLDDTHTGCQSPRSLEADLLKESFVCSLGELVWQGGRYRLLFPSRLGCRLVHRLCCEGPLISGGRGRDTPSLRQKPTLHTTIRFFSPLSLLITHFYSSVHCTALPSKGDGLTLADPHSPALSARAALRK